MYQSKTNENKAGVITLITNKNDFQIAATPKKDSAAT